MIEHYLAGGDQPVFHAFEDRDLADPYGIAGEVLSRKLDPDEKDKLVSERYELPLARAIYATLRSFDSAVNDAIYEKKHPQDSTRVHRAEVIFEPLPNEKLTPGPAHDLQVLAKEMFEKGARILNLEAADFGGPIEWTLRPMRGWYGQAKWEEHHVLGEGGIQINRLLDSPDISAEAIRFLLWHEYLHVHFHEGHTKKFRQLERQWPGHIEADRELDTLNERFGVWYW